MSARVRHHRLHLPRVATTIPHIRGSGGFTRRGISSFGADRPSAWEDIDGQVSRAEIVVKAVESSATTIHGRRDVATLTPDLFRR